MSTKQKCMGAMTTMQHEKQQIEFTLASDGHLTYRGSDDQIIYELTRRAREQADAYHRYHSRQDPIAVAIFSVAIAILLSLVYQIATRPSPQYLPQAHETYRP